jgi:hypothetical protein
MGNTIIGNSTGGADCSSLNGSFLTASLVEDGSCNSELTGDPGLEPLRNNGGPTKTHALRSSSIARDSGDVCSFSDQRGKPRPITIEDPCDIGSFEFGPGDDTGFIVIPLGNGKVVVIPE